MLEQFIRKCTVSQLFGVTTLSFLSVVFGICAAVVGSQLVHKYSERCKFEAKVYDRHKEEWKRFGVHDCVSPTDSADLRRLLKEAPDANWVAFYGKGVDDNSVTEAVKNIKDLRILSALNTNIGDAGLEHLTDCRELRRISFGGPCRVTDKGLLHLQRLTKLEELGLGDAAITDDGLIALKPLVSLKTLHLGSDFIKGEGLLHLAELPNLVELSLHGTGITNDSLKALKQLKKLERVYLHGTRVTDEGLKCLAACPNIKELFLGNTSITDVGLGELKGLKQLELLDICDTRVSDTAVSDLRCEVPNLLVNRDHRTLKEGWPRTVAEVLVLLVLLVETIGCGLLAVLCIRNSVKVNG